jgi:ribosomal protein S18 acetylase RimI-like enzyme
VHVLRANSVSDELRDLWDHAIKRLKNHRGGPELYTTIRRDVDEESLLTYVVTSGALWTISDEKRVLGFALVRDEVVEGVFVHHEQRRQRVATTLLRALVAGENAPKDGLALPGDRGMKSLYESLGWKARLLTMRGE